MKAKSSNAAIEKISKSKESKVNLDKFEALIVNNAYMKTIIKFTAKLSYNARSRYNFRSWKYTIIKVKYTLDSRVKKSEVLSNFGYGVILEDRTYL